jgi:hypothetical protein
VSPTRSSTICGCGDLNLHDYASDLHCEPVIATMASCARSPRGHSIVASNAASTTDLSMLVLRGRARRDVLLKEHVTHIYAPISLQSLILHPAGPGDIPIMFASHRSSPCFGRFLCAMPFSALCIISYPTLPSPMFSEHMIRRNLLQVPWKWYLTQSIGHRNATRGDGRG